MTKTQLKIIKKALYDVEMMELKRLEMFPVVKVEHSQEYTTAVASLIKRKQKYLVLKWLTKRKFAVLIAAILILTITITGCAFGEQIKDFFFDVYETFTRAGIKGEPNNVSFKQYTINWVPEGYTLIDIVQTNYSAKSTWYNGKHQIYLEQDILSSNTIIIDTENTPYKTANVGEIKLYYTYNYNTYTILWIIDNYEFSLICHDSIDWCNIEKMIESISN